MCQPAFSPTFKLSYEDKIFTIGSCFARNIERALTARGFHVATAKLAWPDDSNEMAGNEVLNSYGVTSIENDLRWALDPDSPFDPKTGILEVIPGKFVDANIVRHVRPAPYETVLAYRNTITDVTRSVKDCRVVVMTLGLSEVWYDTIAKSYLNVIPPRKFMALSPERFELHILSFEETMRSLRNAIGLLTRYCRADQRVLLTVSPVPLGLTHTQKDALVANSYSKAVLRTAAEHLAAEFKHVDYFPSYESVTLSDRAYAWENDQIHVQRQLINVNVERMIEAYQPDSQKVDPQLLADALSEASEEVLNKNFEAAIRVLEPLRDFVHQQPEAAMIYADLCLRLGRAKDALAVVAKLPHAEGWQRDFIEARALIAEDKIGEGLAALLAIAEKNPNLTQLHRVISDTYLRLGRWEDALVATRKWAGRRGISKHPEAMARVGFIYAQMGDLKTAEASYRTALEHGNGHFIFDFVELLIEQKRLQHASDVLETITLDTRQAQRRYDQLRAILPIQ
jgi:tetratricopeptide (TPR) repeat protein